MTDAGATRARTWPLHGWLGLALVAVAWPANWLLPGLRTQYFFFPLWLGFIFTVDAIVLARQQTSLVNRLGPRFVLLFVASAPAWWLFELINLRLGNWIYLGREEYTDVEFALWSTLSFSIVLPAVFEAAELIASLAPVRRLARMRAMPTGPAALWAMLASGIVMLAGLVARPDLFFPLTWLSLVFVFEPLAWWLGRPGLLASAGRGDWRPALSMALGALLCGVFWELWNVASYPKWVYDIPYLDVAHVFEMPLLGYFGYLPFGLELYPLARLLLPLAVSDEVIGRRARVSAV